MTETFPTEELLSMMKKISLELSAQLELKLKTEDMSGVQVYFLAYILRHHKEGSCLTELCREVGVSKPTLSVLVKKLREKGYLCFQENPGDIRRKKILPTARLLDEGDEFLQKVSQMETEIYSIFSQKEKESLGCLEQKLLSWLTRLEQEESQNRQVVLLP